MFYIGQQVLCVDNSDTNPLGILKKKVYIIEGILKSPCCGAVILNVGIRIDHINSNGITHCSTCEGLFHSVDSVFGFFRATRFVPLEEYHYKGIVKEELITTN